jgi:hypothetical protein
MKRQYFQNENPIRLKRGLYWPTAEEPKPPFPWAALHAFLWVLLAIAAVIIILHWMAARDLRLALEQQKEITQTYIGYLAQAFNGGSFLDKATDTAYFFSAPSVWRIEK